MLILQRSQRVCILIGFVKIGLLIFEILPMLIECRILQKWQGGDIDGHKPSGKRDSRQKTLSCEPPSQYVATRISCKNFAILKFDEIYAMDVWRKIGEIGDILDVQNSNCKCNLQQFKQCLNARSTLRQQLFTFCSTERTCFPSSPGF